MFNPARCVLLRSANSLSCIFRPQLVVIVFRPLSPLVVTVSVQLLGLSRLITRCRPTSSSSLCQDEVINISAPCSTPLCHGTPPFSLAADAYTALLTPKVHISSYVEPCGPEHRAARLWASLPQTPTKLCLILCGCFASIDRACICCLLPPPARDLVWNLFWTLWYCCWSEGKKHTRPPAWQRWSKPLSI